MDRLPSELWNHGWRSTAGVHLQCLQGAEGAAPAEWLSENGNARIAPLTDTNGGYL